MSGLSVLPNPPRREWMTRTMVADYLGVSLRTVDSWTKDRGLPAHKRGNAVRFDRAEVDDWFSGRSAA